jgi:DNA primase
MNSPETPLFSKGRELYGLFEARDALRSANCAVVVEGYMDVVMLAQHGVGNAVATLGTATTPEHVRKLLRIVDRVVFSFDGDAAGRKAAWRALEACLPEAADTKRMEFLFLPAQHDPDSFVREHGLAGFESLLADALPLSEFLIQELSSRVDLEEPEGRARFLALAKPLLQALPVAALRLQLLHRVADVGAVGVSELERFVGASAPGRGYGDGGGGGGGGGERRTASRPGSGAAGRSGAGSRVGLRPRAGPPDLVRRVRLLSALHPALAFEEVADPYLLPPDVVGWLALLGAQPAGSSLAVICESLKAEHPEVVAALERDAAADRSMVAEMSFDEARAEFEGALAQLRDRSIREQLDALVAAGMRSDSDRARYHELLLLRHKT